jgi:polysaccharide export outer membrane protein
MVRIRGILLRWSLAGAVSALGGCGVFPTSGPAAIDVLTAQHNERSIPYALVQLTPKVSFVLGKSVPRLTAFAEQRRPQDIRFGIGDVVSVTIFEASSGGLFIPAEAGVRPGNFIAIPNQAVDVNGNISIPYAGTIRARGRTPVEVQDAIVDALKNRAIEPQAIVSLAEQKTSLITVLGDVGSQRIKASASPERILDVIARAGGPTAPGQDVWVLLERNGKRALAPFGALIYEPVNNIYIHAEDTIYLYHEPQTFLTFGALGSQQQIPFGAWRISLAEAISKAGGLKDDAADPALIFLYRGETRDVAQAMGVDCSQFQGPIIPIIYSINLRDPSGYFLATSFEMRNKDVIYVSNSLSVETTKFMTYISTINQTINDPITTATNIYALKNIISGNAATAVITGSSLTTGH